MVGRLAGRAALVAAVAGRDVDLAAEDRLDAALAGRVVEHHRREHVAVLGHRQRRHLQRGGLVEQFVDAAGAVEQRELGVEMEMDELSHRALTPSGRRDPGRGARIRTYSHSIVAGGFELMS